MDRERIQRAEELVKKELQKMAAYHNNNTRLAEYRIEHSFRVANIGAAIAREEGFDEERTYLACLMHDIGYSIDYKTTTDYKNHGRYGARMVRPFLRDLGYSLEEAEEMCYGIAIHVDGRADFSFPDTPLALTVRDADNIDRFDAYRLYAGLQMNNYMNLPLAEQRRFVELMTVKLIRLQETHCGTAAAERMWQEKTGFQLDFYHRLMQQIKISQGPVRRL